MLHLQQICSGLSTQDCKCFPRASPIDASMQYEFGNFMAAIIAIHYAGADSPHSDELVGEGKDSSRDCEPKRRGGLQVYHEFEPSRLLDRQIGGLGAFRILSTSAAACSKFSWNTCP